jgi:hypothetical protein
MASDLAIRLAKRVLQRVDEGGWRETGKVIQVDIETLSKASQIILFLADVLELLIEDAEKEARTLTTEQVANNFRDGPHGV